MTKPSSASGVTFRKLDDLFEPTDGRADLPQLAELDVESLIPFKDHPFREYPEEKMQEMVESVTEHGILMPILVRPIDSGEGYEIISGHNRVEACRRAGIKKIPATIREMDDDTATIVMVDSNLRQRDKLLPSEKAKAYKMKLDAIRRKAGRPSKNAGQFDLNSLNGKQTRDLVGEEAGDSGKQVQRFIRLNNLTPALLGYVDDGTLAFNPAVEVSYLDPADQEVVFEIMEREQISPSLSQAQKLHKLAQIGRISEEAIEAVMTVEKPMYTTITLRQSTVAKYFPAGTSGRDIERTIIRLLEEYRQKRENKKTYQEER
ncbi:MAG: ParB/RepB/Spo0J family partition protein [Clostridia bacterium]|nr:ParB/RepB/Spo0J family partition protein [Clostridia bacterium]MBQ5488511.1 ParB/RepB/Spo0J family partition protein [Clostridia bacterium]